MKTFQDLIARVQAEFLEMPGLHLTAEQVQRLCGIERTICELVLGALVASDFLCVKPDGQYARVTEGGVSRQRRAKAALRGDTRRQEAS